MAGLHDFLTPSRVLHVLLITAVVFASFEGMRLDDDTYSCETAGALCYPFASGSTHRPSCPNSLRRILLTCRLAGDVIHCR